MLNHDDLLAKKITDMENGVPLETVLQDLPEETQEIEQLIRLAAAVRSMPHPEPAGDTIHVQRQKLRRISPVQTQPAANPMPMPAQPAPRPRISWKWIGAGAFAAAGATTLLFVLFVAIGLSFWWAGRSKSAARVDQMTGQVQVATNRAATQWKNLAPGALLRKGDQIRTLGASGATLVFFENTRTVVLPNAELAFAELNGANGALQVKIEQKAGETWNIVTPFQEKGKSYFLVETPSGTASVHGTRFGVKVGQTGQALFSVDSGEVRVANDAQEITLLAGQATSASPGGTIAAPTYQFSLSGSLNDIDETGSLWTISGVAVQVTESTQLSVEPELGVLIEVTGRILEDGSRVADSIAPATDQDMNAFFTGVLMEKTEDAWQVSGISVLINKNTVLDESLEIGTPVKVTFNTVEDAWLALKIEALVEDPDVQITPEPSATADPRAKPSYEFEPDELESAACGSSSLQAVGTLRNTSGDAKDYAANVQLGYLIDRGGEYVNTVVLNPERWTRIDSGQTVSFDIQVGMNEAWASAPEGTEVKVRIFVASASNRPDHLNGRLTVTFEAGCKATPTPGTPTRAATQTPTGSLTPQFTSTATSVPTAAPTLATPDPGQPNTGTCTGANPHPTGMKLAQRYGVSYEEIMSWFCQHYGFGEIDLAYSLSRASGKPVTEVFAMRASGQGWGAIKKALQTDKKPDKKDKPDKKKK